MTNKTTSTQEQLHIAEKNLEYILEWVSRFDNKSSVVLGINTGMLGVLATFAPQPKFWTSVMVILTIFSVVVLAVSLLFIYLGSYPRLKGPSTSLFYFGSIAKNSFKEYQQAFLKRSDEDHLNDMLEQCHRNSEILDRKFWCLKWAYRMLLVGVLPWAISIYLFRTIPSAS